MIYKYPCHVQTLTCQLRGTDFSHLSTTNNFNRIGSLVIYLSDFISIVLTAKHLDLSSKTEVPSVSLHQNNEGRVCPSQLDTNNFVEMSGTNINE